MGDSFVQVAPDGTGKLLRTRNRTVGANSIHEQYVIVQNEMVPINRLWVSTLRIPCRAVAASGTQPLFSVFNGIAAGGNNVNCRRLSVEIDSVAQLAGASPILRLFRMSAQAATPGGTVLTPERQYLTDPAMNTLVSIRADHQGDLAAATTALAFGTMSTQPMWSQTVPRLHVLGAPTAGGPIFQSINEYNLMPNDGTLNAQDPLIIRPQEGFAVRLDNAATALTAGMFTFSIKGVFAEFTYP